MYVDYDEIREQKSFLGVLNSDNDDRIEDDTTEMTYEIREPKSLFVESEEESPLSPTSKIANNVTFWPRQIQKESTSGQRKFDWIFGVALPIICFAFDPVIFGLDGAGMLSNYTIFAYILSIVSIMSMAAWLLWRERLGWLTPVLGGIFLTGSFVSLTIGILMIPISLLGLIIVIGALGFTPLLTTFIYFRNSVRAFSSFKLPGDILLTKRVFIISAIFALVIPFVINFQFVDPSLWLSVKDPFP